MLLLILLGLGTASLPLQERSPEPEREMLGGCILMEPTSAAQLKAEMPDLVAVIERTVGKTLVASSRATLEKLGPTRARERAR